MRLPLLCVSFALLLGCPEPSSAVDAGDASVPPPDAGVDGGVDAGADAGPASIQWSPCTLHSEGNGPAAECGLLTVPLAAGSGSSETIDVFVKRFRPAGGKGTRALWMLQGGPGGSGYAYEAISQQLATRFPDVDYYLPDHRGTGRSARLGCPAQEAPLSDEGIYISSSEWPACRASISAALGPKLNSFNTTQAANDLSLLIEAARKPGQPVLVLGVSYGTYWAHRYLQMFPSQADGVVLDSIAAPGMSLLRQDQDSNEAARDFMGVCATDPFCRSKLGNDPWMKAEQLVARLKAGHCAAVASPGVPIWVLLRRAFASFLMDAVLRAYVPAVVYRFDRCSATDVSALQTLVAQLTQTPAVPEDHRLWGWVLGYNILFGELAETPRLTAAELSQIRDGAVASRDITLALEAVLDWPAYPTDAYIGRYADTATPMLMLSGGLDPATLLRRARDFKPHFTRPHQTWIELPTATHTTFVSSPFTNELGERRSCSTSLIMQFVNEPRSAPDAGCVARVESIDFTLPRLDYNQALFGRSDAWE